MKNFWKSKKTPSLLGIDTSNGAVKITELTKKAGYFLVTSCTRAPYSNENDITVVLGRALDDIGGRGKSVAIALPDAFTLTQKTYLDATLKEDEISMRVYDEASKYFNVTADALCLDFQILDGASEGGQEIKEQQKKCVFWVAVKKSLLEMNMRPLIQSGLAVDVVEITSLSLQRAYSAILSKDVLRHQVIAIAHFYDYALLLIVLRDATCIYTAMEFYGNNGGGLGEEACTDALKKALRLFYASFPGELLPLVYLSCDDVLLGDISKNMSESMMKIDVSSVFINMAEICAAQKYSSYEFLPSLGLAMRGHDPY